MPAYNIESSIVIDKNSQEVHKALDDFKEWPVWSPWLYMEPEARLDYRGQAGQIGHGYDWKGDLTGAGGMTMTRCEAERLEMDLQFIKPFKSRAAVAFDINEISPDQTRVTWKMASSLPFFMFFMVNSIKAMITADYERGLRLLKDYVETGATHSSTEVIGLVDVPGQYFIGISDECAMADMQASMDKNMALLDEYADTHNIQAEGPRLSIYYKMDTKKQRCTYSLGHPASDFGALASPMEPGQIQNCRALKVVHTGYHQHLGNAWSTAIANQRAQKLKPSKTQAPFEVYITNAKETAPEDMQTEIYLPIR